MEKLQVRVVGKSFRRTPPGGVLTLSRRDAHLLERLGRVEIVEDGRSTYVVATDRQAAQAAEVDVEFSASEKLDEALVKPKRRPTRKKALSTPEAPLKNVAHEDAPKKRRTRKRAK